SPLHHRETDSGLHDALVRLLRAREDAARLARHSLRRGLARRRSRVPAEALRSHGRLDRATDHDRRRADRRLYRTLATRPQRAARGEARGLEAFEVKLSPQTLLS